MQRRDHDGGRDYDRDCEEIEEIVAYIVTEDTKKKEVKKSSPSLSNKLTVRLATIV